MRNKNLRKKLAQKQYSSIKNKLDEGFWKGLIDTAQSAWDWASIPLGVIPGVNLVVSGIDAASAGIDVLQGDYEDAAWRGAGAAAGLIPVGGSAVKIAGKGAKAVSGVAKAGKAAKGTATVARDLKTGEKIVGEVLPVSKAGAESGAGASRYASGPENAYRPKDGSGYGALDVPPVNPNLKEVPSPVQGGRAPFEQPTARKPESVTPKAEPVTPNAGTNAGKARAATQTADDAVRTTQVPTQDRVFDPSIFMPRVNHPIVKVGSESSQAAKGISRSAETTAAAKKASKRDPAIDKLLKSYEIPDYRSGYAYRFGRQVGRVGRGLARTATKVRQGLRSAKFKALRRTVDDPRGGPDPSRGSGENVRYQGWERTNFVAAPTAQNASFVSSAPQQRRSVKLRAIEDHYEMKNYVANKLNEAREMPVEQPPQPFEGQGTQARMQEPMLSTSTVKSGPFSTRARRAAMLARMKLGIPSQPGLPSPEHVVSDIDPKYAGMPIDPKSLKIPATRKILRKKD